MCRTLVRLPPSAERKKGSSWVQGRHQAIHKVELARPSTKQNPSRRISNPAQEYKSVGEVKSLHCGTHLGAFPSWYPESGSFAEFHKNFEGGVHSSISWLQGRRLLRGEERRWSEGVLELGPDDENGRKRQET